MNGVGIVIIGRNEGKRLERCFDSVCGLGLPIVYVDSASTDGSCELARARHVSVVALDSSRRCTPARGRNAGVERLLQIAPDVEFVQFVDGDCELAEGWIVRAAAELMTQPIVVAVCGRLSERHSDASIYNRLCEMEWNGDTGEIPSCGGIFMARKDAFLAANGFNSDLALGEEADLCLRWRKQGMKIVRLNAPMGRHDAGITRFSQWWLRATRAGSAHAHHFWLNGLSSDPRRLSAIRSVLFYGAFVPTTAIVFALLFRMPWVSLLVFSVPYILLFFRVYRARRRRCDVPNDACLYAAFCVIAKYAELMGAARFIGEYLVFRQHGHNIEYRHPAGGKAC